jgi:hypothetical protein
MPLNVVRYPKLCTRDAGADYLMLAYIGRRPRTRTGMRLGLNQAGMPFPFRRLLTGRPGQDRTDFGGLSDHCSAIELQDIYI